MKITATQYAQLLYEATKEKSHKEIDGAISNFIKVLIRSKQTKNIGRITRKFKEIYNRENKIVEAQVVTRGEMSDAVRKHVSTYVSNKYKAEKVELENITDESIGGGVIIKVGDEIMDGSVTKQLKNLKKVLIS